MDFIIVYRFSIFNNELHFIKYLLQIVVLKTLQTTQYTQLLNTHPYLIFISIKHCHYSLLNTQQR